MVRQPMVKTKPAPKVGMKVEWDYAGNTRDIRFRRLVSVCGEAQMTIRSIVPDKPETTVTLTRNGSPVGGFIGDPMEIEWRCLRPVP